MERVKFRKGVTEEVRHEVREIMCGKVFYEAYTGMAASLAPMFTYLAEKGYHAVFHVDCIEIVPIKALEEQRKALEDRIAEVKKPINDKIAKIDAQIEALKKESDNENV